MIRLGLEAISNLCKEVGNPQDKLKFIHVAGTNGKGSTSAYMASILRQAGYRVGLYSTPYVIKKEEVISINGRAISGKAYKEGMELIDSICKDFPSDLLPTEFEKETALAFMHFANKKCDIVVLECGMGGESDATNIIKNTLCAVFTPMSLDHMDYLGDTIEKIARVKAGIIKPGSTVVSSVQSKEVLDIIEKKAASMKCTVNITWKVENDIKKVKLGLSGVCQYMNAQTAVNAIKAIQKADSSFLVSDKNIENGLHNAKLSGRFEIISKRNLTFILDGGHNEAAALCIKENIEKLYPKKNIIMVCGMLVNKDHKAYLKILLPKVRALFTVSTFGERAYSSEELAKDALEIDSNMSVSAIGGIEEAIEMACVLSDKKSIILVCGSFTILEKAKKYIDMQL